MKRHRPMLAVLGEALFLLVVSILLGVLLVATFELFIATGLLP